MNKQKIAVILVLLSSFFWVKDASALTTAQRLSGRILLQVESRGEAWYVNVKDNKKYYLGRPDDAFALMKKLSLGISEKEFASWNKGAPAWAKGGLFIRPQSHGEAYYVDLNGRWNYLGRPMDAWLLFRSKGLGISNADLAQIPVGFASSLSTQSNSPSSVKPLQAETDSSTALSWKYGQKSYSYSLPLSSSINKLYSLSQKSFYYGSDMSEQAAREKFYSLFFTEKTGDEAINNLISYANSIAASNFWSEDKKLEFLMSIIQYIPYDHSKLNDNPLRPNYPYETLFKNSGICSDKTFLAVAILRELGYGAAILDFPDVNHSAAGVSCPAADSVNGSGYCYIETTNYFPIGVIPPAISGGQAVSSGDDLSQLFDSARMSKMEVYQKTSGKVYQGVSAAKKLVGELQEKKQWLESEKQSIEDNNAQLVEQQADLWSQRQKLDQYQAAGDRESYNALVGPYNTGVNSYNTALAIYQKQLETYNNVVKEYNNGLKTLYQQ